MEAAMDPKQTKTPAEIRELADIFRQRAGAGWTTLLSPATTHLVADALDAYVPKPPPAPVKRPGDQLRVDLYAEGSTIYRLTRQGEIFELVAWARNSLVARVAFDELVRRYPRDHFSQRRRSFEEGDSAGGDYSPIGTR